MVKPIQWNTPAVRFAVQSAHVAAPAAGFGVLYLRDDSGTVELWFRLNSGSPYKLATVTGGGFAPADAKYIVQTSDPALTNAQALGALATGILKNTTTTGVLTIAAAGTDYITPDGAETLTSKTLTTPTISPVSTPVSPANGALWMDTDRNTLSAHLGDLTQRLNGTIWSQTSTTTISNVSGEVSLTNTGIGTTQIPANFLQSGRAVRIRAGGYCGTAAIAPTLTARVYYGTTLIVSSGALSMPALLSNAPWTLDATIVWRTVGVSGTSVGHNVLTVYTAIGTPNAAAGAVTTPVTTDTTANKDIDVTMDWDTADTANELVCTWWMIEVM